MSDIQLNIFTPEETAAEAAAAKKKKKRKDKWFRRKLEALKKRGSLNHQAPVFNGVRHLPTATPPPPPPSTASQSSSKPSASPCLTFTVNNDKSASSSAPSSSSASSSASSAAATGVPAKFLAIDCEMVGTGPKGSVSHLARCSVVSYDGDVVYDKFVKPAVPVTDYRTRWSGIRHRDLLKATPFAQARKEILKLLAGKVVVGHAVHNDFKVLGYAHPAAMTRDTSRIPLLNQKAGFAEGECASLKRLTKAVLQRDIQTGRRGHSSVEDAKATMELYRVVEAEWERKLLAPK
ncbi:unnamed protein product [Ophioblennius macclurei]